MFGYNEQEIVNGLKKEDEKIIRFLYKKYFPSIRNLVSRFNKLRLEPEDIFQEGMTRMIINIRSNRYKGNSSIYTYFYSICKNICLKEISKKQEVFTEKEIQEEEDDHAAIFDNYKGILEILKSLKEECQQIIRLRFNLNEFDQQQTGNTMNKGLHFEEIASQLELSPANARQRFKRCLDKLRTAVLSDSKLMENFYTQ